jgi:DMSO/TMAO reductase YedYZ heme-binding membrane subunit
MIYNNKSFMNKSGAVSCCLTLTCLFMAGISGILYIFNVDNDSFHQYGEVALFMLVLSFLSWLIGLEIREENRNTKVTPV